MIPDARNFMIIFKKLLWWIWRRKKHLTIVQCDMIISKQLLWGIRPKMHRFTIENNLIPVLIILLSMSMHVIQS